jgi:anti-sigma B factor antagonist
MEAITINTKYYPENKNIVIVELGGYIDQTNCNQVEKVISDIVNSEKLHIVFDLTKLVYMSSAGWGIFVGEIKMVRDLGGDIKIASMSPEIYEVFSMLEFYHIIQDYATVEEAVESFRGEVPSPMKQAKKTTATSSSTDDRSIEEILEETGVKSHTTLSDQEDEIVIEEDVKEKKVKVSPIPEKKFEPQKKPLKRKKVESEEKINIARLPVAEKVKHIASHYPLLNIFQIRKMLQHEKFGQTEIGLIKLFATLRRLNLETVTKRYRYYRSI